MTDFAIQSLTYDDMIVEAQSIASDILPGWKFTDKNDPLRFVLDVFLRAIEHSNWFSGEMAQEYSLLTARDRRSVFGGAARLTYQPQTRQPALISSTNQLNVKITLSSPLDETIQPYAMQIASSDGRIIYENYEAIIVQSSDTFLYENFVQGKTVVDSFVSAGKPHAEFRLSTSKIMLQTVISEAFKVVVNVTTWTRVESFRSSTSTDEHYMLILDYDGNGMILFGNGVEGKIPPSGDAIVVAYRVGLGEEGRVLTGSLSEIVTSPSYVSEVTNLSDSTGGSGDETAQQIKINAPASLLDGGQYNKPESVEAYLNSRSEVSRNKSILIGTTVISYVLPAGGYVLTGIQSTLENDVEDSLMMGYSHSVRPPKLVEVTIEAKIYVDRFNSLQDVGALALTALDNLLNPTTVDSDGKFVRGFGDPLRLSEIGYTLKSLSGVYDYEITLPTTTIFLNSDQIFTNAHSTSQVKLTLLGGRSGSTIVMPWTSVQSQSDELVIVKNPV